MLFTLSASKGWTYPIHQLKLWLVTLWMIHRSFTHRPTAFLWKGVNFAKKLHSALQKLYFIKLLSKGLDHALWDILHLLHLMMKMLSTVTLSLIETVFTEKLLAWHTIEHTIFVFETYMLHLITVILLVSWFRWASKACISWNLTLKEVFDHMEGRSLIVRFNHAIFTLIRWLLCSFMARSGLMQVVIAIWIARSFHYFQI